MSETQDDDPRVVIPDSLTKKPKTWKRADVLAFLEANKEKFDLDDKHIDVIRINDVSGLVFLQLTRELLLQNPFMLSFGAAVIIETLINKLIRITKERTDKKRQDKEVDTAPPHTTSFSPFVTNKDEKAPCPSLIKPTPTTPDTTPKSSPQRGTSRSYRTTSGSASSSQSQYHKNLDNVILEEIRGTVYVDVSGFETFFNHVDDSTIVKPQQYSFLAWGTHNEKTFEEYGKLLFTEVQRLNHVHATDATGYYYGSGGIALQDAIHGVFRKCDIFLSHKLPTDKHQIFMNNIMQIAHSIDTLPRIRATGGTEKPSNPETEKPRFSWKDIRVVGEFKSSEALDVSKELIIQLGGYVREVFGAQPTRLFVHAFSVCGYSARLWMFDRAGVSASKVMDLSQEADQKRFICALVGYINMSPSQLGFDERYKDGSGGVYLPNRDAQSPTFIEIGDKRMKLMDIVSGSEACIVSRGTLCWKAIESGAVVVIKDAWRDQTTQHEATFWRDAQGKGVTGCLEVLDAIDAEVVSKQDSDKNNIRRNLDFSSAILKTFKNGGPIGPYRRNTTVISKSALPDIESGAEGKIEDQTADGSKGIQRNKRAAYSNEQSTKTKRVKLDLVEARVHNFMVVKNVGEKLEKLTSPVELLEVFRDAIKCHQSLYELAGILHCDISVSNIMKASGIRRDGLKGFLIDLDYAQRISIQQHGTPNSRAISTPPCHQIVTGTPPFMALEILLYRPVVQTWRHDLESFLYVLLWVCVKQPEKHLENWYSVLRSRREAGHKQNDMSNGFDEVLDLFKDNFQELKDLATNLRDILFYELATNKSKMYLTTPTGEEARKAMYKSFLMEFGREIEKLRGGGEHKNCIPEFVPEEEVPDEKGVPDEQVGPDEEGGSDAKDDIRNWELVCKNTNGK